MAGETMSEAAEPPPVPPPLAGATDLAQAVCAFRKRGAMGRQYNGRVSDGGVHLLIQTAYQASLLANEGRYPRVSLLVPTALRTPKIIAAFEGPLTAEFLRRLGPVLSSPLTTLVVTERRGSLEMAGIASVDAVFEGGVSDPLLSENDLPPGLTVEIHGPGDLRAGELTWHRLTHGVIVTEPPALRENWFHAWVREVGVKVLPKDRAIFGAYLIGAAWHYMLKRVTRRKHGGCFVVLDDPTKAPLRATFRASGCNLVDTLRAVYDIAKPGKVVKKKFPGAVVVGSVEDGVWKKLARYRQLYTTLDILVQLAATDGCVVFDRGLNLYSFGSMIEVETPSEVPVFKGTSDEPLSDERLRTFGSRRRSAIRLCQSSSWALAFVVSQDGEVRGVVGRNGEVRLYDTVPPWW